MRAILGSDVCRYMPLNFFSFDWVILDYFMPSLWLPARLVAGHLDFTSANVQRPIVGGWSECCCRWYGCAMGYCWHVNPLL